MDNLGKGVVSYMYLTPGPLLQLPSNITTTTTTTYPCVRGPFEQYSLSETCPGSGHTRRLPCWVQSYFQPALGASPAAGHDSTVRLQPTSAWLKLYYIPLLRALQYYACATAQPHVQPGRIRLYYLFSYTITRCLGIGPL